MQTERDGREGEADLDEEMEKILKRDELPTERWPVVSTEQPPDRRHMSEQEYSCELGKCEEVLVNTH